MFVIRTQCTCVLASFKGAVSCEQGLHDKKKRAVRSLQLHRYAIAVCSLQLQSYAIAFAAYSYRDTVLPPRLLCDLEGSPSGPQAYDNFRLNFKTAPPPRLHLMNAAIGERTPCSLSLPVSNWPLSVLNGRFLPLFLPLPLF